nr:hypothetical protein [uncultured Pseudomonas sp.]
MSGFNPLDSVQRDSLISNHPVVLLNFLTLTPTVESVYTVVREVIFMSKPSMYFYSSPRMGKSQCAKLIKHMVQQEFSDKLVVLASGDIAQANNIILTLFSSLDLVKHSYKPSIGDYRARIINHIRCELAGMRGKHCLFIIDELQVLSTLDYKHLQTIQNELKMAGISLTVIGFAQEDINSVKSSLSMANELALIARFLSKGEQFPGCSSVKWLNAILTNFDEALFYPVDSTCSFTNFFLPMAFEAGFRMRNMAEQIFNIAYQAVSASSKIIPTEHLFIALGHMLASARAQDKPDFVMTKQMIKDAIILSDMSLFAEIMKVTVKTK